MRVVDHDMYIHELDRKAMAALQAIPAFPQLVKAFLGVWNERLFYIENMSSNLRISEQQLPQYHKMLVEICEKLGIDVPEMYMTLDVVPNAYTYGDTKPFIVLTSGLIETLPEELIPTVIAHECGHIVCRHTLYRTIGSLLCNGALNVLPFQIAQIASYPLVAAFSYWMRCSEFSADRVAVLCDGNAENMKEVCARFAGFDKDVPGTPNMEAFMNQAAEYMEYIKNDKMNLAMEFIQFFDNSHPLNAVRAFECNAWQQTDDFKNLKNYMFSDAEEGKCDLLPLCNISANYIGSINQDVMDKLRFAGFTNIETTRLTDEKEYKKKQHGEVVEFTVNGLTKPEIVGWYKPDSLIEIAYYLPFTDLEISEQHPGEAKCPLSAKKCLGKVASEIEDVFRNAGFNNIETFEQSDNKGAFLTKEGGVTRIAIGGNSQFKEGDWLSIDAPVRITIKAAK